MYIKDKSIRITLRVNDEQFSFVKGQADTLGVSPSEFLRMVINASLAATKQIFNHSSKNFDERLGVGRENDKADINDSV